MEEKKCGPKDFITWDEHSIFCEKHSAEVMRWANEVIKNAAEDRVKLWSKSDSLETALEDSIKDNNEFIKKVGGYFIKGLLGMVAFMLFQVFVLPRLTHNGEQALLVQQYKLSQANNENLKTITEKLGVPYTAPEGTHR